MAERARVRSVDALAALRLAVLRFRSETLQATMLASSEIGKLIDFIERDRKPHWKKQITKREELVTRAKVALQQAEFQKRYGKVSTIDERRALARAREHLQEAKDKHKACKEWLRQLERERMNYEGQLAALSRAADVLMPRAAHRLKQMGERLDEYANETTAATSDAVIASKGKANSQAAHSANTSASKPQDVGIVPIARLRRRLPIGEDRLLAPQGVQADAAQHAEIQLSIPWPIRDDHNARLKQIAVEQADCDSNTTALIESALLTQASGTASPSPSPVAIIRTAAANEQDTGWTILGSAPTPNSPPPTYAKITSAQLDELCSGISWIMNLPRGWGVLIDPPAHQRKQSPAQPSIDAHQQQHASLRCIFDRKDHIVWGTLEPPEHLMPKDDRRSPSAPNVSPSP